MQRAPGQNDRHEEDRAARSLLAVSHGGPQHEGQRRKKQQGKEGAGGPSANLCRDDAGAEKKRGQDRRLDVPPREYPCSPSLSARKPNEEDRADREVRKRV